MSLSIRNAQSNSLIIIDEFGKGTSEVDGLGILVACLEHFILQENDSPLMFVSSHFHSLPKMLPQTPLVKYQVIGNRNIKYEGYPNITVVLWAKFACYACCQKVRVTQLFMFNCTTWYVIRGCVLLHSIILYSIFVCLLFLMSHFRSMGAAEIFNIQLWKNATTVLILHALSWN